MPSKFVVLTFDRIVQQTKGPDEMLDTIDKLRWEAKSYCGGLWPEGVLTKVTTEMVPNNLLLDRIVLRLTITREQAEAIYAKNTEVSPC